MGAGDASFDEFWHQYLRHHAKEGTRMLHMLGTGLAALALVVGLVTVDPLIVLAGTALGRPAMVSHPAWAFQCDIRMFRLWITGQLKPELAKAGVA